jgi:hypothetical protein
MYPTGLLLNVATGRIHPISFRPAPMPANADANMSAQRWRSIGHHTEGFDTEAAAMAWIAEQGDKVNFVENLRLEWNGEGLPAMTVFLTPDLKAAA